jgi:hypothetical protein
VRYPPTCVEIRLNSWAVYSVPGFDQAHVEDHASYMLEGSAMFRIWERANMSWHCLTQPPELVRGLRQVVCRTSTIPFHGFLIHLLKEYFRIPAGYRTPQMVFIRVWGVYVESCASPCMFKDCSEIDKSSTIP